MKHYLPNSLRVLFLSLAVLLSLPMLAVEVEIDGINYELVAKVKQATVIAKSSGKYSGKAVIPESVEHEGTAYSVTSIGKMAFRDCSGLTSVTIPNSVTSIEYSAFDRCSGLTSVTIPNSVTSIGEKAFYKCSGLTSVTIPNSVTSIGDWAFSGCSGLTSVTIPNSVTSIGAYAFRGCSGLTSVTIPNSVTSIEYSAFGYCEGLTSVTIPNSVESIGNDAFVYCTGLTSVHISDIAAWCNIDFASFSSNPLYYAHHLYLNGEEVRDLVIPNSVTSIGDYAFQGCSGLTSVTIPNSVTSIGSYAFHECSGLTSVTIPNSVTSIGMQAFRSCSSLTSVTIPNSVTSIGNTAFAVCSGLTSVTIGNSVTSIGKEAFYGCSGLTSVTIPNSVTSIGELAFANCTELLYVYCYAEDVPSTESNTFKSSPIGNATLHVPAGSVDSYNATAPWNGFGNIVAISTEVDGINYDFDAETKQAAVIAKSSGKYSGEVIIPESVVYEGAVYSVTSIVDYAFEGCSGLTSVTIPNSVTSIGDDAFECCSGLTSVHISDIAAWCNIDFGSLYSNPLFYAHHLYLNGEEVKDLVIPNSVTSIGNYAFDGCSGLTSVTIPNSVTSIGDYAFFSCSGLTSVHISDIAAWCNIDFGFNPLIEAHHLYLNGEEVKDLVIPNSVTSIGDDAFECCYGLTSVTIPNSVTNIGDHAFAFCSGLTSIVVEEGNPVYDSRNNCNAIIETESNTLIRGCNTTIIPNSVTSIGSSAFQYCSGLTSVTIPNSVTSIGSYAFTDCYELHDVYCYAENVPSTESNTFVYSPIADATLHVPAASIESYKATAPWSGFGKIVGLSGEEPEQPEVEKCATPVVTYVDGCLEISCETEGAEFVTDIASNDFKKHYVSKIELSATYNIEVYATKANCENSDTVSVALVWVENGEVNEETGVISVPAAPVLVQGNGGILTVSGVVQNTEVVVCTIDGMEVDRAVASDGTATIYTGLQSGTIVVVKFGNKSVKVRI